MEEQLIPIGFLIILIGIVIVFVGFVLTALKSKETKIEWGFGGFIGPIPFGWASSRRMLYLIVVVSLVFFILFLILGRLF